MVCYFLPPRNFYERKYAVRTGGINETLHVYELTTSESV